MRYDWDRKLVKDILLSSDIANTIGGGMSQPEINISKQEDHYLIQARVPGVELDEIEVEIVDHHMILHHDLYFKNSAGEMKFPKVIATTPITADVDYENITANIQDKMLVVVLPFSELDGGYNRKIKVHK